MRLCPLVLCFVLSLALNAQRPDAASVLHVLDPAAARVENALQPFRWGRTVSAGVEKQAAMLHPTNRPATAEWKTTLPAAKPGEKVVLFLWAGMDDAAIQQPDPKGFDGVRFSIFLNGQEELSADLSESGWRPISIDLDEFQGKPLTIVLSAHAKANSNYDWFYVAEPQVLRLTERLAKTLDPNRLPPEGVLILPEPGFYSIRPEQGGPHTFTIGRGARAVRYAFPGASSVRLEGPNKERAVHYGFQPRLKIAYAQSQRAVVQPGEGADIVVAVANTGLGTYSGGRLELHAFPGANMRATPYKEPENRPISPGATAHYLFRVVPSTDPNILFRLRSDAGADAVSLTLSIASLPQNLAETGKVGVVNNRHGIAQNDRYRLIVSPSSQGGSARLYVRLAGRWSLAAASSPLATASLTGQGGVPKFHPFRIANVQADPVAPSLTVSGTLGPIGRATLEYKLVNGQVECSARMTASQTADIYSFRFPDWRVGDGSFGIQKSEAVFPGLEWLTADEGSSSVKNVSPPNELRLAPHPYKITMPLMAVRSGPALFMMHWEPWQTYAGSSRTPSALFYSPAPDEIGPWTGAHHRLALFVPSPPGWIDENALAAKQPFRLAFGEAMTLKATVHVNSQARSITEAFETYSKLYGVARPPAAERTGMRAVELSIDGLLAAWVADQRGWKHTNTGPVYYDPTVATPLWILAHSLSETDMRRQRAIDQVRSAVPNPPGWQAAFYLGGLHTSLKNLQSQAKETEKSQKPDGSWDWKPESDRHKALSGGQRTSSGLCGQNAGLLWQSRLMLGDRSVLESANKALDFLDGLSRPDGAQTWELTLSVPDILAAERTLTACLNAYAVTANSNHLSSARRWALSGLPFVYCWSMNDRPIMRGAAIPAFGATWLTGQPWFGVAVQWCGLAYARALFRLAELDNSLDWRTLAEAIALSGVQQQAHTTQKHPENQGFYPDAYSIVKGDEEYHWDLNPRLLAPNVALLAGIEIEPRSVATADRTITAPGLRRAQEIDGALIIELSYAHSLPATFVLVASGSEPAAVQYNGQEIPKANDLDRLIFDLAPLRSGFAFDAENKWLMIRLASPGTSGALEIR